MLVKNGGFTDFLKEFQSHMVVVDGNRIEALACATVASLNTILVAHIEGGEVSGTIDEMLSHSISKFSHLHFLSNEVTKRKDLIR